jgi:hypothetical protein
LNARSIEPVRNQIRRVAVREGVQASLDNPAIVPHTLLFARVRSPYTDLV